MLSAMENEWIDETTRPLRTEVNYYRLDLWLYEIICARNVKYPWTDTAQAYS